ncbi:MAG: hypothetical protein ACYC2U_04100 [Candidatus Amoebophilus sp.]
MLEKYILYLLLKKLSETSSKTYLYTIPIAELKLEFDLRDEQLNQKHIKQAMEKLTFEAYSLKGSLYNYSLLSFLRSLNYNTQREEIDIEICLDADLVKIKEIFKKICI